MTTIKPIFKRLENLTQKEGQSEFASVVISNVLRNEDGKKPNEENVDSYKLLKLFLEKIIGGIDELSTAILNDDSILISVKDQKLLRTCFQLITSVGIATCLIPGLGLPLTKRITCSVVLPKLKLTDEEKYELLVECTNFFTRCYKVPVLKNIIVTFHLSDYLAALIQLAFAPLKKPGSYSNFVMTQEMYDKLNAERPHFISTYEQLVEICFQPTLMREMLVLQSVVDPSPPVFVKRVISKELSRRLLVAGGVLSLIRCFIESYDIDTGSEWKKMDMICRLVSIKHGTVSEDEYLANITSQLAKILCLKNTQYLATAAACLLNLSEKYPASKSIKMIVKDIFQAFDYDDIKSKSNLPGTIILSPQEVDHKVNILHACVCSSKTDWNISLIKPNLYILFLIGVECKKSKDLKAKLEELLIKCLEKLSKNEIHNLIEMFLFAKDNWKSSIEIAEWNSGVAIKSVSPQETDDDKSGNKKLFLLELLKSPIDNDLVKKILEVLLDILIEQSVQRKMKANKDLMALEEDPILLNENDDKYLSILQLLSEMSSLPKIITVLKTCPYVIINFIEHSLTRANESDEECTTIALVLLSTVLSNTNKDEEFEKRLVTIVPMLRKMSQDESSYNHILCKEALSFISSDVPQQPESACGKALNDVFDNLLPVRAHGILELTKLIDAKDPETLCKKHYIYCIFQEQLKDPDSYIYLSAINGLASLCTHCSEDVLHVLCKEFLQVSADEKGIKTNNVQNRNTELRMKTGDVIVKVISRLGEMAIVHKTVLLNTMLCGCRDDDPFIRASALSNLAEIARVLHYKIGSIIYEVLLCIWSIIETDKAIECRRAAVMVISSLFKGLGKETLIQLKENLLPIYRTLKSLYKDSEEDSIVKLHAQIALEELNDIVNSFLFPEVKMEKPIYVLDKNEDMLK